ncbi:polysaccharide biosynthesis tyrosine autokinase [Microbacterium sp. zg-YB36]|uniref:polysaccharide biosynthesis tyrosine autokinase n=1 Tax=Microbacterium sp. zg-YB36 TaxID=2969407 RepID=UPI00214C63EA|nr:polysaccharide biosynthesis tyrosine autokinase [Microbacterium sp. zg-YB36]MDL5352755.1 polysaccharide biosynthesis tyrosine autokinase [Microbacterium sp. zg-YB36]
MELREYVRILRRNWAIIVAVTLLGVGVAAAWSLSRTPEYRAQSTVFVSSQAGESIAELEQGSSFTQSRVATYANLVTTPIVLDPAVETLDVDVESADLAAHVRATVVPNTSLITIAVTDTDPERAADTANAVAASLAATVEALESADGSGGTPSPVRLTPVHAARAPQSPSGPNVRLDLLIGGLIGAAVGMGAVVLRTALDTRISSARDLVAVSDRPLLGMIPFDRKAKERPLIVQDEPLGPRAEAFRALRTNLQFLDLDTRPSFVITSSEAGEGKSTTLINLATVLADAGRTVALVDADLRRPRVAALLGIEGGAGLTDVLIGRATAEELLAPWRTSNLRVLPAGTIPPNPSELLDSARMRSLLTALEREFDIVLLDAPPLLPVTDAAILAKETGGAIVVVAAGRTKTTQLAAALATLDTVGAKTAGIVMTMVPLRGPDAQHAFGYRYGDRHADSEK